MTTIIPSHLTPCLTASDTEPMGKIVNNERLSDTL